MFDFNLITTEQEKAAIAKFKEYGEGISMGRYTANVTRDNTAKWADLIDNTLYSVQSIKVKMLEIARHINTSCNDEFMGDTSVAFTVRDARNKQVKFSYLEMYIFLRGALRFRKETEEYKTKAKALVEAKTFVEANKSTEDKLKEAIAKIAALELEIGADN
jgi:hypothetical protein